jgi:hypothetical protein
MDETYAYFRIIDFKCDFSDITKIMELEPTKAWNKGAVFGRKSKHIRKESSWKLYSPLPRSNPDVVSHVTALLETLEPRREAIIQLRQQGFAAGLVGVSYFTEDNLGVVLSEELISQCASLGLSIALDLYCIK